MIVETDIQSLVISRDALIREALARINGTPNLVQIVVDSEYRIVGMVTDGDVRRALVNGADLETAVKHCMQKDPVTATSVESALILLPDLGGRLPCVPVVDSNNVFTKLVCESQTTPGLDTAIVMAGGFGTRLGERTRNIPKPLIEVGGKPILWHILKDLQEHGISRVFIAVHYLADQIVEFVDKSGFNLDIELITENSPLGTAGSLGLLPSDLDGPLLITNGDIVTRTNYASMLIHHQTNQREATIGAARYEQEVPYGVLQTDNLGNIVGIDEKPKYSHYVSAGIYIVQPSVFQLVSPNQTIDMPDLLRIAIGENMRVGLFPIHEYWMDLGHPKDLEIAEAETEHWLEK
jgi:dTDP-glucose pyrophosphorylase